MTPIHEMPMNFFGFAHWCSLGFCFHGFLCLKMFETQKSTGHFFGLNQETQKLVAGECPNGYFTFLEEMTTKMFQTMPQCLGPPAPAPLFLLLKHLELREYNKHDTNHTLWVQERSG